MATNTAEQCSYLGVFITLLLIWMNLQSYSTLIGLVCVTDTPMICLGDSRGQEVVVRLFLFNSLHAVLKKVKIWLFSPKNSTCYLKNHWTNTRLVCTQLSVFFMLNSNMVLKIWNLQIFWKNVGKFWDYLHSAPCSMDRVNSCFSVSVWKHKWNRRIREMC